MIYSFQPSVSSFTGTNYGFFPHNFYSSETSLIDSSNTISVLFVRPTQPGDLTSLDMLKIRHFKSNIMPQTILKALL